MLLTASCLLATVALGCGNRRSAWTHQPPDRVDLEKVPQFVAVTFDDNFGLEDPTAVGGVDYIVDFFRTRTNPRDTGPVDGYDGTPIATTLYNTTIYITENDDFHRNSTSWWRALAAGHEMANHTVHHWNGGDQPVGPEPCCTPRNFTPPQWSAEIKDATEALTSPKYGVGAPRGEVVGFRAPYLGYNDALFAALVGEQTLYDSSLLTCFGDTEDGTNCAWPYHLDEGSRDAEVLTRKFKLPVVTKHPGLWEAPISALLVPPDSQAAAYGFRPGLRARIEQRLPLSFPNLYEPATGKIAGLDVTLLVEAKLRPDEMLAILKYNLDLHLRGNRAPLIFVAHAFMYAFTGGDAASPANPDNPNTTSAAERDARWKAITDFLTYALTKPEVRLRPVKDIIAWLQRR